MHLSHRLIYRHLHELRCEREGAQHRCAGQDRAIVGRASEHAALVHYRNIPHACLRNISDVIYPNAFRATLVLC